MDIKKFAEQWIEADKEAFRNGNFELLEKLEDRDMVGHPPLGMPDMVGYEAHKQLIIDARQNYSDIENEWQYLTGEGNLMVIGYKSSFRGSNKPDSARDFSSDEILVLRVENGKIVECWAKGQFKFQD